MKNNSQNFVFVNENQFTCRSSQNYTLNYYHLTFSESNRLIVSVICAWLSIKAISMTTKQKHEQHKAEQLNHKLHTEWSRERAGDFDLTGKCDWKRDRKCSTWGMRRRFAAVLRVGSVAVVSSVAVWSSHLSTNRMRFYFFQSKCVVIVSSPFDFPTRGGL